jgi:hypothetical protein
LFCAVVLATSLGYLPEMLPPLPHIVRLGFFVAVMQIMMGQLCLFAKLAWNEHNYYLIQDGAAAQTPS